MFRSSSGILRRRSELERWQRVSFRWFPCRYLPWIEWQSRPACACTSAPCESWWSGNWCRSPRPVFFSEWRNFLPSSSWSAWTSCTESSRFRRPAWPRCWLSESSPSPRSALSPSRSGWQPQGSRAVPCSFELQLQVCYAFQRLASRNSPDTWQHWGLRERRWGKDVTWPPFSKINEACKATV